MGRKKPFAVTRALILILFLSFRYCLDDRKSLERDGGFSELQSRLIRYETQTTCTRESVPVPTVLSPLPSPAALSEPGSVPDGEALQGELRTEVSRLKRRSNDQNCLYPNKRSYIKCITIFSIFFITKFIEVTSVNKILNILTESILVPKVIFFL